MSSPSPSPSPSLAGPPAVPDRIARLGWLTATPDFLAAVPRAAFSMAIRTHQRAVAVEGELFQTRHSFEGTVFCLRTNADRTRTEFRLDDEP